MSRNHTAVPASVFALRAFVAANVLTLTGAFYTGHDGLWSLSILLSLALLAVLGDGYMPRRWRDTTDALTTQHPLALYPLHPLISPRTMPITEQKTTMTMSHTRNPVILTQEDYNALQPLAAGASPADEMTLAHELRRAIIVRREALPPHTIRLTSRVTVKDLDTAREMSFSIVMPAAADMREKKISILTPMGTALIGFRAGEEVEWKVPAGVKRFKILTVVNGAAA